VRKLSRGAHSQTRLADLQQQTGCGISGAQWGERGAIMFRNVLLFSALSLVPAAIGAQILMPGGAKPVTKPAVPVMVMPVTPVTTAPVGPVNANRTVEMLKNAGIVNPTLDRPISLTPRTPIINDQTYLGVTGGSLYPGRNMLVIDQPNGGVTSSWAVVSWNASPDRRYVLDCAFEGNAENYDLTFSWERDRSDHARVAGGHAGIVLPAGAQPPVRISAEGQSYLKQCDITPFGS
jgi:hypothetical protein